MWGGGSEGCGLFSRSILFCVSAVGNTVLFLILCGGYLFYSSGDMGHAMGLSVKLGDGVNVLLCYAVLCCGPFIIECRVEVCVVWCKSGTVML